MGTSPRTRGKLDHQVKQRPYKRNIPAHAGKTLQLQPSQVLLEEHPRARGENACVALLWR